MNYGSMFDTGFNTRSSPLPPIAPLRTPTTYKPPVNTISSQSSSQSTGNDYMQGLYNQIMRTNPARTAQSTTVTKQNESQAMQDMINNYMSQLNNLNQQTTAAHEGKFNTYNDLIRSLSDMYRTTGSAASSGAVNQGLSSGLTPSEAGSMGQEALLSVLQQYNPALAQITTDQSQVRVDAANALAQIMQSLQLPFSQNVEAPYYQGVAGQTQTGNTRETDPMAKMGILAQLASQMDAQSSSQRNNDIEWAKLQQQNEQFGKTLGYQQQGQSIAARQAEQEMQLRQLLAQMNEGGAMDRTQATNLSNEMQNAQRLEYQRQERMAQNQFAIEQLLRQYSLNTLGIKAPANFDNKKAVASSSNYR
jgi:hypothetical protein